MLIRYHLIYWHIQDLCIFFKGWHQLKITKGKAPQCMVVILDQGSNGIYLYLHFQQSQQVSIPTLKNGSLYCPQLLPKFSKISHIILHDLDSQFLLQAFHLRFHIKFHWYAQSYSSGKQKCRIFKDKRINIMPIEKHVLYEYVIMFFQFSF